MSPPTVGIERTVDDAQWRARIDRGDHCNRGARARSAATGAAADRVRRGPPCRAPDGRHPPFRSRRSSSRSSTARGCSRRSGVPRGPRIPAGVTLTCDLLLVGALTWESGGAFSQLRAAFLALPLGAALLLSARRTAAVSLATGVVYLVVAVAHPATSSTKRLDVALAQGLYVIWVGCAAVVLSTLLNRRRQRVIDLAAARGRLVAQALDAEDRARKRLSDDLHDHAIQNVLTARQDLADAQAGDASALERAEHALRLALGQLRSAVRELHPYLLDHLDLPSALATIAEQHASPRRLQLANPHQPRRCRIPRSAAGVARAGAARERDQACRGHAGDDQTARAAGTTWCSRSAMMVAASPPSSNWPPCSTGTSDFPRAGSGSRHTAARSRSQADRDPARRCDASFRRFRRHAPPIGVSRSADGRHAQALAGRRIARARAGARLRVRDADAKRTPMTEAALDLDELRTEIALRRELGGA